MEGDFAWICLFFFGSSCFCSFCGLCGLCGLFGSRAAYLALSILASGSCGSCFLFYLNYCISVLFDEDTAEEYSRIRRKNSNQEQEE